MVSGTGVGVGLLSCVCAVFDLHLPTGNVHVTREPEVAWQPSGMTLRSMRNEVINHISATQRDVDSLTVFWRSAGAPDDVEHAEFSCCREFSIGFQVAMATCAILIRALERRSHPHSGPQQRADRREWQREESVCEVFNAHEFQFQSCKISWSS